MTHRIFPPPTPPPHSLHPKQAKTSYGGKSKHDYETVKFISGLAKVYKLQW